MVGNHVDWLIEAKKSADMKIKMRKTTRTD